MSVNTHEHIWNVAAHVFVKAAMTLSLCELGRTGMLRMPLRMTIPYSFQISRYSKEFLSDVFQLHINSNMTCISPYAWTTNY